MKMTDMTCPKCGAIMKMDSKKETVVCEYCGALFLLEKEETLEEIRAKAEAKAYGYHKGKMAARRTVSQKKSKKWIPFLVVFILVFIAMGSAGYQEIIKPEVNPFSYIEVTFRGTDGKGEMIMEFTDVPEGIDVNCITYDASKERWLSQGESISIQASSSDYRLTEQVKTYTVCGLDEYLKDLDTLSDTAIEMINKQAEQVQELNLSHTGNYFVDMVPVKMFLVTDGKRSNSLYDVFEVRFQTEEEEKILYIAAYFTDIIVRNNEQAPVNMSYGVYTGHLTSVQWSSFIMGYDSVDEVRQDILMNMESYLELKERDL